MICYIGQKLHRFLSSSAWKQLDSIWDSHSEWSWNIILWSLFVSQPSTVRVTKFSNCALSRPGGTDGAPHAPKSAWQAVNHVWSFICQSPPKCCADDAWRWTIPIPATPSSSCLAERLPVSQSQRSQFGASDSSLQHSMISLQRLQATSSSVQHRTDTEQHFFFHSSGLFGSLTTYQPPSTSPEFIFIDMHHDSGRSCICFLSKQTKLWHKKAPVVYL